MASSGKAIHHLMKLEGFYSNHQDDAGGETQYGISRRYWPEYWEDGPPDKSEAYDFYRAEFWVPLGLGEIMDQRVANELLDQAVNFGHKRASRIAQISLNMTLQQDKLVVDGIIGPKTLSAINGLSDADTRRYIRVLNGNQYLYYVSRTGQLDDVMDALSVVPDPSQDVFFRGWMNRIGVA